MPAVRRREAAVRSGAALLVACMACALSGCASVADRNVLLGAGALLVAGRSPSATIEQLYYLGIFDPQDQLRPALYRVRVRGAASALSSTKFGSYWVPAAALDSLSASAEFLGKSGIDANVATDSALETGRRLVLFGPEGFREAPKNHRLVILMGSNIDAFVSAVDQGLGAVAAATSGASATDLDKQVLSGLYGLKLERERLNDIVLQTK